MFLFFLKFMFFEFNYLEVQYIYKKIFNIYRCLEKYSVFIVLWLIYVFLIFVLLGMRNVLGSNWF